MKKTNHRQNHTYPRKVRLPTFDWWKLSLSVIYSTRHVVIPRYSPRCYVTVVWINQSNKVDFKKGISSRNLSYRRKDDTYSIPSKCVAVATVSLCKCLFVHDSSWKRTRNFSPAKASSSRNCSPWTKSGFVIEKVGDFRYRSMVKPFYKARA